MHCTALHWAGSFRRAVQKQAQTPRENGEAGSRGLCNLCDVACERSTGLSGVLGKGTKR